MKYYLHNLSNRLQVKVVILTLALITLFSEALFSQAPVADFTIPNNGETLVSLTNYPRIIFEDEIILGSGTFEIKDYLTEDVIISVNQDSPNLRLEKFNSDKFNTLAFTYLFDYVLDYSNQYYVTISDGLVKSTSGVNFSGFTDKSVWNFTTSGPGSIFTVSHRTPSALIDPAGTFQLKVAAGQHFQMGSVGNLRLVDLSNGNATLLSLSPGASEIVITNNVITFNFSYATIDLNEYAIRWDEGFFENTSGGLIEENNGYILYFKVYKAQNPILEYDQESFWPHDIWGPWEQEGDYLNVGFDRPVKAGSGKLGIYNYSNDQLIEEIDVQVDVSKIGTNTELFLTSVDIFPATTFTSGERYYVLWDEGVFLELSSSALPISALTDKDYWTFTMDGSTPLEIVSVSPIHQSEIEHTIFLEIDFSSPIEIHPSAPANIFVLKRYDNDEIFTFANKANATIIDDTKLRIRLNADPTSNTYYVEFVPNSIREVGGEVLDVSGFDKEFWHFTTNWQYLPRTFSPANFSDMFPLNGDIKMVFNEEVKRSDMGSFTLRKIIGSEIIASIPWDSELVRFENNEVYFDVNHLLEFNTQYFITMSGVAIRNLNDLPAEQFNNNTTWVFRTEPDPDLFAQPVSFSPMHQSIDVSVNTSLAIEFSNTVTFSSGQIQLYNRSTGDWIRSINNTGFTLDGNTVTIDVGDNLPLSTEIAVLIQQNTFVSEDYNVITINDNDTWYFTTATPLPIELLATYPTNGATDVSWGSGFELEFNQPLSYTGGNGKIRVKNYASSNTVVSFRADQISTFDNWVEINFDEDFFFNHNTKYYLEIDAGAFENGAGEAFEGFIDMDDYTFVANWDMPGVTIKNPVQNATDIDRNQTIAITFDRPIELQTEVGVSNEALFHIRLRQTPIGGGSFVDTNYFIGDDAISYTGNTLTITPNEPLDYASEVNVLILNNVVMGLIEDNGEFDHLGPLQGANSTSFYLFTTEKEPQTITFTELDDVDVNELDGNLILEATASSELTVNFEVVSGPATLVNGNELEFSGTGIVEVKAYQPGNDHYAYTESTQEFNVFDSSKEDQTITFSQISDKTFGDADFDLTATASSGLTVSYSSNNTSVATISGSMITIVGAGTTTITASQGGDATFNPAASVNQVLTVNKASQTITFPALLKKSVGDSDFILLATASSGLPVSFVSANTDVAIIDGNTLTITGAGMSEITASQSGNSNYLAAENVKQTLSVNNAPISTRILSLTGNLEFGEVIVNDKTTRNLTISNTGNETLTLQSLILPPGFTGKDVPEQINAGSSNTIVITFEPTEAKIYDGTMEIVSNATDGESIKNITGVGILITKINEKIINVSTKVTPNPGNGRYVINSPKVILNSVQVMDITGRSINIRPLIPIGEDNYLLEIYELPEGVYYVRTNKFTAHRIIKIN